MKTFAALVLFVLSPLIFGADDPGRYQLVTARVIVTVEDRGRTGSVEQPHLFRIDTKTGETAILTMTMSSTGGTFRAWWPIDDVGAAMRFLSTNSPPSTPNVATP